MNWAWVALGVTASIFLLWLLEVRKRRWAWPGLIASVGCLMTAGLNSAAPLRGLVDPEYMGYVFGLVSADRGLSVTLLAGSIFLAASASALIAAGRRSGPPLWIVSATCAALAVILGVPTLISAWRDPAANSIQFGEYLTVPGMIGTFLLLLLLLVPFLIGGVWGARAALRSDRA
jgi:hypothetical protein